MVARCSFLTDVFDPVILAMADGEYTLLGVHARAVTPGDGRYGIQT